MTAREQGCYVYAKHVPGTTVDIERLVTNAKNLGLI